MKILLPVDHSICSSAAARAVIAQFPAQGTEVRVMHAVEWPKGLAPYVAFAEGVTAARAVLDARADQMESGRFLADGIAHARSWPNCVQHRRVQVPDSMAETQHWWHLESTTALSSGSRRCVRWHSVPCSSRS